MRALLIPLLIASCSAPAGPVRQPPASAVPTPAEDPPRPQPAPVPEPDPEPQPTASPADPTVGPADPRPPLEPTLDLIPSDVKLGPKPGSTGCDGPGRKARDALGRLASPCEADEDCELGRVACPFGCVAIVSTRADRKAATEALRRYYSDCPLCKHKCAQPPATLACVEGRCQAGDATM